MNSDLFTADAVPTGAVITCSGCGTVLPDERAMLTHMCPPSVLISEISTLTLKPGDILAVNVPGRLTRDQADCLRKHLREHIPEGIPVLLLDGGISLLAVKQGTQPAKKGGGYERIELPLHAHGHEHEAAPARAGAPSQGST